MLFVFPRLCIDVVQFYSKFAIFVTLQKKLSSGGHKVAVTENRAVGVIRTSQLWGRTSLVLPRALKTLATPLSL